MLESSFDSMRSFIFRFFDSLNLGYPTPAFLKDFKFYVLIQVLIAVKVAIFFLAFGHGVSYGGQPVWIDLPFVAVPVFGNVAHVFEYAFHQSMHVLIALWVFLLARRVKHVNVFGLSVLFLIATVLHNVGYWLTFSHSSLAFSVRDFGVDFVSLWIFFLVFRVLQQRVGFVRAFPLSFFKSA